MIAKCTSCKRSYEAGTDEPANYLERLCPECKHAELDADDRAIANRHDDGDWWRTQGNPDWVEERNRYR